MFTRRPGRFGFTLVEVLVAVVLLAVSLFFLISLLPTASLSLRKAQDTESAALYGQSVIDSMRQSVPLAYPSPTVATPFTVTLNGTQFTVTEGLSVVQNGPMFYPSPPAPSAPIPTGTLYKIEVWLERTDHRWSPTHLSTLVMVSTL